jgi:hypothetical protein
VTVDEALAVANKAGWANLPGRDALVCGVLAAEVCRLRDENANLHEACQSLQVEREKALRSARAWEWQSTQAGIRLAAIEAKCKHPDGNEQWRGDGPFVLVSELRAILGEVAS